MAPAVLIGLVIGVLLDAVVVRLTLLPAVFTLLSSRPAGRHPSSRSRIAGRCRPRRRPVGMPRGVCTAPSPTSRDVG